MHKFKVTHEIYQSGDTLKDEYVLKVQEPVDNTTSDQTWWKFVGRFPSVENAKSFAIRYTILIERPLEWDI